MKNRTGLRLENLNESEPGDILRFRYNSGSNPGEFREAAVIQSRNIHIETITKDGWRNFSRDHATEIEVIDTFDLNQIPVPFDVARKEICRVLGLYGVATDIINYLNGDELATEYKKLVEPDAHRIMYDETKGAVMVTRNEPEPEPFFKLITANGFTVCGPGGKCSVFVYPEHQAIGIDRIDSNGKLVASDNNCSPQNLQKNIKGVLTK